MLGICNLIWTICHKLISFLLKHCFSPHDFHRDAWWNLWWSGSYGYFKQNSAAIDVLAKIVSYSCFIETNTIALGVQRFAMGANVICLTYARDWWGVTGPVIHCESKSQAIRSSLDHVGLLHTLSTIDTQESKLRVRLVLEVLAKLMVGENSSWEFPRVLY